jgi:hypothetical protein
MGAKGTAQQGQRLDGETMNATASTIDFSARAIKSARKSVVDSYVDLVVECALKDSQRCTRLRLTASTLST